MSTLSNQTSQDSHRRQSRSRLSRLAPRIHPRPRVVVAIIVAALVLLAASLVALSLGDRATPLTQLFPALVGRGEENVVYAVREVRLPRLVLGIVVGFAFGVAGGLSQGVLRNPLASPDVLGVTSGASVGAVAVIALGATGGPVGILPLPVAALIGGFGAAALIALLAIDGALRGRRILLVGIAISTALTGVTQYLLTRMDVSDAQRAAAWLTGSLNARGWDEVIPLAIGIAVLLPIVLALGHDGRALLFDSELSTAWGVHVGRVTVILLACSVSLTALATAAAGPVTFVALVAGQLARRTARVPDIPPLLSGLTGALIVVVADTIARTALPVQLPVGVLTAVVGAPYLLYLLQQKRTTVGTPA